MHESVRPSLPWMLQMLRGAPQAKGVDTKRMAQEYRALFHGHPGMMWITDAGGTRFLDANHAAAAFYGFSRAQFLRLAPSTLWPEEAQGDGEPRAAFLRNEPRICRHVTQSGRPVLVEVARYAITFRGRDAWLALVTDVGARLAGEMRLRDEIDALKSQLEAMRGDVAGARQLAAAASCGIDPRAQELARLLAAVAVRELVDLSAIAENHIHLLRLGDPARRVHVEIEPGLQCTADAGMARALLRELLANAWQATATSRNPWLRMGRADAAEGTPGWFIADNGAGFDGALPQQGLGFAIAAAAVRRHNGRLWAQAAPGQGATFSFTLAQAPTGV